MIFICENCGKEFKAKPSSNRKFCSQKCYFENSKGKPRLSLTKEKVEVVCANCGKHEFVQPCRAKKYVCCSTKCLGEYKSKTCTTGVKCVCPICGKEFRVKQSRFNRTKGKLCCSKECSNKLKEVTYLGENNHQYGLKGHLNSSFKGDIIYQQNHNLTEILVYAPYRPDADQHGRVKRHRLIVQENYNKFDSKYFDIIDGYRVLKEGYVIHHIDENHNNDNINNLMIVTNSEHRIIHNKLDYEKIQKYKQITGVLKQGELLETPEVDNQQPSSNSNILEGSETSNRILENKDSNITTSALLQQIKNIIEEDIVRPTQITNTNESVESKDKELLS